jgi:two-component system, cell cycle sensor histidine kinase and response regulator CckA
MMKYGRYVIILILFLLVGYILLYLTYENVKHEAIDNLKTRQMIHAKQAAKGIEAFFHDYITMLQHLAKNKHIVSLDASGKQIMRDFYLSHAEAVSIITRIDSQGRILHPEPYNPKVVHLPVTQMEDFLEVKRTGQVVVSDVFTNRRGLKTIIVHIPVFRRGHFDGSLAVLLPFEFIAKRYVEDIRIGQNGYAWIISRRGIELFCPVPGHVGNSVFDNCRDFPDILEMAKKMTQGEQGVTTYLFDRIRGDEAHKVVKQAVFMPIHLGNNFWSIVVATPEDEVLGELKGFRNKLMLIALLLVIGLGYSFYMFFWTRILAEEIERRRKTEEILSAEHEKHVSMLDGIPIPAFVIDRAYEVVLWNRSSAIYTGKTKESMLGKRLTLGFLNQGKPCLSLAELLLEMNDNEIIQKYGPKGVKKSEILPGAIELTRPIWPAEEERTVFIQAARIYNPRGEMVGAIQTAQDITLRRRGEEERKRLESQLLQAQKMEAVGTLAGGITHNFNNLLMGIQGYASLMLMGMDKSHPHYEKLRAIEDQVQSGADLSRQLLGFARGGRYEVKPTDLNELIGKAAAMFGRTKKEILIHEKYAKNIWIVDVDRGQIEQVLLNLFVNAWQAMPGGGELFLATENIALDASAIGPYELKSGPYVKLSITDTGVGMDENTRRRIFDPFFTTKGMGRGTGLGLASTYGIIKGHEGFINVYSERGHGATFNIYLPASHKKMIGEDNASGDTRTGDETILVVDDEDMIADVTRDMLEGLGYHVLVARSGQEAVEIYEANPGTIDLVILDMIMPGMNGGETFDRIKSLNADVKVILSSGYSINDMAKAIMERGVRSFLQKPFRLDILSQRIRDALES